MTALGENVIGRLLDSDPALRWQVERDLVGEPEPVWAATRARVATEGIGARLLAHQDPDGQWAGGAYFPADVRANGGPLPGEAGQPWTATTWSLTALREWGLDAAVLRGTADRIAASSRWEYGDLPYWGGEIDCCINAMTLANGLWLGADASGIADWFVEHVQDDGGWNCERLESGAVRSSFHSTLNALYGLLAHETATGGTEATRAARRSGEEYLLRRRLLFRLSTGELVGDWVDHMAYPFRWRHTVLRATEYLRRASLLDGTAPDPRAGEAVERLRAARQPDGTWLQGERDAGRMWFEVDVPAGRPSPWLTLYGTRVLDWWDGSRSHTMDPTS